MKIVQAPNPVLSTHAKPVAKVDKTMHRFIAEMEQTLLYAKDPEGVGLAAPQVGKSLQFFIVKQTLRSPLLIFVNPKIESVFDAPEKEAQDKVQATNEKDGLEDDVEDKKGIQLEGCLSLKDIWGVVKRSYGVVLSYEDETGKHHKKKFEGFLATIIQHESDHLNGILFPKRVLEQKGQLYRSKKNAKGETEFDEITL